MHKTSMLLVEEWPNACGRNSGTLRDVLETKEHFFKTVRR
jgi:hypothetical protein